MVGSSLAALAPGGGDRARLVDGRVPVFHQGSLPPLQDGVHATPIARRVAVDHVAKQLKVPAVLAVNHRATADKAGELAEAPVLTGVASPREVQDALSFPAPDPEPLQGVERLRAIQVRGSSLAAQGAEIADLWAGGQPTAKLHSPWEAILFQGRKLIVQ